MKKICFPTDFSELSLKVLPFAIGMAKKCSADLYLVNVLGHWSGMYPEGQREALLEVIQAKFKDLQQTLEEELDVSRFHFKALQGDVQDCIEGFCKDENVDLLVMSTHGYSGIKRVFMGSVTKSLIHTVSCPTLALTPSAAETADANRIGPILLPIDIDHVSQKAVAVAKNFALKNETSIDLLYALSDQRGVVGVAGVFGDARIYRSYQAFVHEETALANEKMDEIKSNLKKDMDDSKVNSQISEDPAPVAIYQYGKDHPHSVVVMETHVKSGVSSFFLGSTTERVIHSVNVPVLILNKQVSGDVKQPGCCG